MCDWVVLRIRPLGALTTKSFTQFANNRVRKWSAALQVTIIYQQTRSATARKCLLFLHTRSLETQKCLYTIRTRAPRADVYKERPFDCRHRSSTRKRKFQRPEAMLKILNLRWTQQLVFMQKVGVCHASGAKQHPWWSIWMDGTFF